MGNDSITRKGFIYSCALGVLGLAGCSSSSEGENDGSKSSDGTFALRGAFLVEPTEELVRSGIDFSSIPNTRKLVICVYDITNSTKKNWDAYPSCSMLFDSENEYEIDSFELPPPQIQAFISRSGYLPADQAVTIDTGGRAQRSIATFLINESDLQSTGLLKIELPECGRAEFKIQPDDIKSIAIPDGIFEVEEKPDGYQLARSIHGRANLAYILLESGAQASQAGDSATAAADLKVAATLFSQDITWGISLISGRSLMDSTLILTELCPKMDFSKVASIDQGLADDIQAIDEHLSAMCAALDSQDYSTLDANKDALAPILSKYYDTASV